MIDEGYIKFSVERIDAPLIHHAVIPELDSVRTQLHDLGFVGVLENGIGFGNVSARIDEGDFIISGSSTGAARILGPSGYTVVTDFNLDNNRVYCTGPIDASSETMTHGVIYRARTDANVVLHIHSRTVFDRVVSEGGPVTPVGAAFGTPEIARAVGRISAAIEDSAGIIAMLGHPEGVMCFGVDFKSALDILLRYRQI